MAMRSSDEILSCVLIGADNLLIECGESLIRKDHNIVAIVAGSAKVASWASGRGIKVIDGSTEESSRWVAELAHMDFDWLFGITHLAIIPSAVLALPRKGAINFHDGPLPRYAGLNTPTWALIDGASTYGVTWHFITEGIDEGDIIASRTFDIDPGETSLSINTRNFGLALDSFEEVIDSLKTGHVRRVPQDPHAERVIYRRSDRPQALCLLDWQRPAVELERLVRALDFGPYRNPMGRAAIRRNGESLSVLRAHVRDDVHDEPGTIVSLDADGIVVACQQGGLALKAFAALVGQEITPSQAALRLGLVSGGKLDLLDEDRPALTQLGTRLAKNEASQLKRLTNLEPVSLPWAQAAGAGHRPQFETLDVNVPAELKEISGDRSEAALVVAFGAVLARLCGKDHFHLAAVNSILLRDRELAGSLVSSWSPFGIALDPKESFVDAIVSAEKEIDRLAKGGFLTDLIARDPDLGRVAGGRIEPLVSIGLRLNVPGGPQEGLVAELSVNGSHASVQVDESRVHHEDAALLVRCFEKALVDLCAYPELPVGQVQILDAELRRRMFEEWNPSSVAVPALCVHQAFEQQAERSSDAVAVIFEDRSITYGELDRRANQLGAYLQSLGVGPDHLVGIHVERGIELMVSVLAVLKAGGAYVPLDTTYPAGRIKHMIADSGCGVILTTSVIADALPDVEGRKPALVRVDADAETIRSFPSSRPASGVQPDNLCYCIYTSGSTGLPKGVLLEHRNVLNFFTGMDERVDHTLPATWLAVTSLSFDISVLELLYTLSRGFRVVIYRDHETAKIAPIDASQPQVSVADGRIDFSLFYFSGNEADSGATDKYRLLLDGARWADANKFCAVWTPERHFHEFGGLYPQPAVTAAAIAAITSHVSIRAGSVVMPLHHPVRVAEAWSMVDNLSNGRAAISVASGWQPNDFILMPENYAGAKDIMFRNTEIVQRLWRGETVAFPGPLGKDVEVRTLPRPVQRELPIWVTTAGNPETFEQAGRIGANVLTHLLGQTVEQLEPKLAAYRRARAEAGFDPESGIVSLMLHTFVSNDEEFVRETVREPLKAYLGTSMSLLRQYAWAFPAFKRPNSGDAATGDELANIADEDRDAILEFAFLRYYETSGLFGTPASAAKTVESLKKIGVNEVACLIDFGIETDVVLANLPYLGELHRQSQPSQTGKAITESMVASELDQSLPAQLTRHEVTHLQCTPSMARLLMIQDNARDALANVRNIFIGGEAFPVGLAKELAALTKSGRVTNMYGPTETTIWSTTWTLHGDLETVPIGTPIANTSIYILDAQQQPLPPGVPGELWIGGEGVARGYHQRPELTAERFVPDPFRGGTARMYRTGDLAKWKQFDDGHGIIEFLGRIDHQVKIRGHRIELGEIEACLAQHPSVRECVVVARQGPAGDQQLAAFLSLRPGYPVEAAGMRDYLRDRLPEAMVPSHIVVLPNLPHTLNGKIDRKALPALTQIQVRSEDAQQPAADESDLEKTVLAAWHSTLGDSSIRVNDNFFDVGGHSLLVVRLHRLLRDTLQQPIALTDLYRFPTVRSFVASLGVDASMTGAQRGAGRAARRLESLQRRTLTH